MILAGVGYIHWTGPSQEYKAGQCWLIPANLGKFTLQPEKSSTVLRARVAGTETLRGELLRAGYSQAQLANTLFA